MLTIITFAHVHCPQKYFLRAVFNYVSYQCRFLTYFQINGWIKIIFKSNENCKKRTEGVWILLVTIRPFSNVTISTSWSTDCKLLLQTNCTLSPDSHPCKYNFICDVNNHDVWWTESTSTFISLIQYHHCRRNVVFVACAWVNTITTHLMEFNGPG